MGRGKTPLLIAALTAVVTVVAVIATLPVQAVTIVPWTGTWSASPQSGGSSFNQQTLRQIVHTSTGGSVVRVQLSNAFGTQPVTVADVHIAQRTSGSAIATGTDHQITFAGSASTTIAAGATAVSDAVGFTVPAFSDVAISIYLPQPTGPATFHQTGEQTNYIASGDVSANASLTGAQITGSYYFLTNLDIQNSAAAGAVVTLGASITEGVASAADANHRWPNYLATRLANSGRTVGVLNQGIGGNRLLVDGAGQSALNRFDRDVLAQPGVRWVIFSDDPINDLASYPPPTAAQLIDGIQQLISRAHQNGVKFLCSTLTPFQGAGGWTPQGESGRESVNAFVRSANSGCDGLVDQDAATHDPANPTMFLPAYDSGDHVHPNEAGMQAIANAVDLSLFGSSMSPTAAVIPGVVQAENYETGGQGVGYSVSAVNGTANGYRPDGVDLEATADTGGGYNIGWTAPGQWFKYTVNAAAAGSYTLSLRVAAPSAASGALHLADASGTNLTGSVNIPATGGWQSWTTVTLPVTLRAGQQVLTLAADTGGWNINSMQFGGSEGPYGGTAAGVPGVVQAENYDTGGPGVGFSVSAVNGTANGYRPDGVDLEATADTGGGYDIGWTTGGQWFKYTVNAAAAAGSYTLSLRVAAPSAASGALHLADASGTNLTGGLNIPATGGWQSWTTVTVTVTLPAGQQVLTLAEDTGGWNINSLQFAHSG